MGVLTSPLTSPLTCRDARRAAARDAHGSAACFSQSVSALDLMSSVDYYACQVGHRVKYLSRPL